MLWPPLASQAAQVSLDNPFGGVVIVPSVPTPSTVVVVPSVSTPSVAPAVYSTDSSSGLSGNSASGRATTSVSSASTFSPPAGLTPQAATATQLINKIIAQNPNMSAAELAGYDAQLATLALIN